jgi:hypothetical protein
MRSTGNPDPGFNERGRRVGDDLNRDLGLDRIVVGAQSAIGGVEQAGGGMLTYVCGR